MLMEFGKALRRAICAALFVCLFGMTSGAIEPSHYAVDVTAAVETAPAQIRLNWTGDVNATSYAISRKSRGETNWNLLTNLAADATGFADTNVSPGNSFEYRVVKESN